MLSVGRFGWVLGVVVLCVVGCGGKAARGGPMAGQGGAAGFYSGFGGMGGAGAVGGAAGSAGWGGIGGTDAALDGGADAALDATISDAAPPPDDGGVDAAVDAGTSDAGPVRRAWEDLYAQDAFPTFEITIPQESRDALQANGDVYQPATLRYGDIVLDNVGIRLKGRASYRGLDEKAAFKIKTNEFVPGQRLLGLKRITLNNLVQDPSMARERLGYEVFRRMGLPAPLCNHARVYVNGEYYGLYANVQSLDDVFVESQWGAPVGNLYDITNDRYHIDFEREQFPWDPSAESGFVLETNEDINDTSDLTALIDAVSESSNSQFLAQVEALMDLDEVLAVGAVQAVISDWDGYFGARNNYKTYHEPIGDRFLILPWGLDQTFGIQDDNYNKLNYTIDHTGSERPRSIIMERCESSTACLSRYHAFVAQAVMVFEDADLEAMLDTILAQVSTAVMEDSRKEYSNQEHQDGVDDLRDFLRRRADLVRNQLP